MTEEEITETEESKGFDVIRHRKQLFGMYVGEPVKVEFEADRSILDPIFDAFGDEIKIVSAGLEKIRFWAEVQLSPMFFSWCCTFGKKLKIIGPQKIADQYVDFLNESLTCYKKDQGGD